MSGANEANAQTELPEPDRLDGFAHPRMASEFVGNAAAEEALLKAYMSGRLPHAWLLTGGEGIGKATLAYRFARFLLSRTDDGAGARPADMSTQPGSRVSAQVAALAHPNLLLLRRPWLPDKKRLATAVTIAEARRLRRFFGHTAGAGKWRVVIIDRAEELNAAAANALLKNLEEPPPDCVFLLVCGAPGRLPVTIRSRCRTLRFFPLDAGELETAVGAAFRAAGREPPASDLLRACVPLAQGSVGRALRLLEGGGSDLYARLIGLMARLPEMDYEGVHALADEISASPANEAYQLFFGLAGEALARISSHAATGEGAIGVEAELAGRLKGGYALAQWAGLWETIQRAKAEADALNLDRKNLVLATFFRLEETARETLG
ncbi:DNA polymerase III subunit tau [bacterium BMS3Bbin10]|nr:DNA polymerase III subunit tau [bacterium BMS3Bbin10]HDL16954.1 DNA polymerase III subunit delta' [Hyphomicrobiales bacterium]